MSSFDFAVGVKQDLVNSVLAKFHGKCHEILFKGKEEVEHMSVTWDVAEPPAVNFDPITREQALEIVRKKIVDAPVKEGGIVLPEKELKALANQLVSSYLLLKLPKLALDIDEPTGMVEPKQALNINVKTQFMFDAGKLTFRVIEIAEDGADLIVSPILKTAVFPAIKKLVETLPPIEIPKLEFEGLGLTPPMPFMNKGVATVLMNSLEKTIPTPPTGFDFLDSAFFLLIKPTVISETIKSMLGRPPIKVFDISMRNGDQELKVGLQLLQAQVEATKDPLLFRVVVSINGLFDAREHGLIIYGHVAGILRSKAPISCTVQISLDNNIVKAKVTEVSKPTFSVETDIDMFPIGFAIDSFIKDYCRNQLPDAIMVELKGKELDLCDLSQFPVEIGDETIMLRSHDLQLKAHHGYIGVSSQMEVS
ncbi:MAG: hypothetical protein ISR72_05840 [Methylobacter sp.]|nr:hypothetical protein [Methylobacter sp.]